MKVLHEDGVYRVVVRDERPTAAGLALRVQIERQDGARIRFRPLQELLNKHFPGSWSVMSFPMAAHLFDDANRYHFLVFAEPPAGFDFFADPPEGTRQVE